MAPGATGTGHVALHDHRGEAVTCVSVGTYMRLGKQAASDDSLRGSMISISSQSAAAAFGPFPASLPVSVRRGAVNKHGMTPWAVLGGAPRVYGHHRKAGLGGQMPDRLDHHATDLP